MKCLHNSMRPGLTLIEVIASIALLSTLLAGAILANSRLSSQIRFDQERQSAVKALEPLIETWMQDGVLVPQRSAGELGDEGQYRWQTAPLPRRDIRLPLTLIRVSVSQAHAEEGGELFHVDLAVPITE